MSIQKKETRTLTEVTETLTKVTKSSRKLEKADILIKNHTTTITDQERTLTTKVQLLIQASIEDKTTKTQTTLGQKMFNHLMMKQTVYPHKNQQFIF